MLVLSRKLKQEIIIGDNIKITVLKVKGNTVRLGIEAPREVHVVRGELPQVSKDGSETEADANACSSDSEEIVDTAEFTVVFSKSSELETEQSNSMDVIPFEASQESQNKTSGSAKNLGKRSGVAATPALDPQPESIQFRGRLPESLRHNRLKDIVNQLASKQPKS
ncbi:MAG: carbon storage regulator [Mariniblastus sp.]